MFISDDKEQGNYDWTAFFYPESKYIF
jgi:hypothetical protein